MGRRKNDDKTPVTDSLPDESGDFPSDSEEIVEEYSASSGEIAPESQEVVAEFHFPDSGSRIEEEEPKLTWKAGSPQGMEGVKTLGPYQLLEEVGRGGMGVVYKAYDAELKRTVALKVLIAGEDASDTAIARFHREAESVAKLGHHAYIVPVYDIGTRGSLHYFAMHFVDGQGLDRLLADREMDPRWAAELCMKIARGLEHAHRQGVLHRDIKPGNILVTADGEPQITDFGLAKDVEAESDITRSGTALGTPQYMPPEQAEGQANRIGPRSDVYSLGATFYHMLTFRPPFRAQTLMHLLKKVVSDDPKPPHRVNRAVDRDLETICLKCLEKDPDRRYESAEALARDLERYLAHEPIEARPTSTWERLAKRVRRNRTASLALAGLVLAIAAGLTIAALGVLSGTEDKSQAKKTLKKAKAREEKAQETEKRAQRLLDKSRKVARVLRAAKLDLKPVLGEFEKIRYASLSPAERRTRGRKAWAKVETFFEEKVAADSASQSVALGLRGWLRYLAGFEEEAFEDFAASVEADPEVAYGLLFEGAIHLSRYLHHLPTPSVTVSEGHVYVDELPEESEELEGHRRAFERILLEMRKAPFWGEGVSLEIRDTFASLRGWREENFSAVERSLSQAISLPELAWIEIELRLARAKARYFLQIFDKALEDLTLVLQTHPRCLSAQLLKSAVDFGLGVTAQVRHENPEPYFRSALDALDRAIDIKPGDGGYYGNRGVLRKNLGKVIEMRKGDWVKWLRLSIDDFTKAIELDPDDLWAHVNRGSAFTTLVRSDRPEAEGRALLEKALADFTLVVKARPGWGQAWNNRASAHLALGRLLAANGKNPLEAYQGALDDLARAEQAGERSVPIYQNRGVMEFRTGEALASMAKDPVPRFTKAEKALRKVISMAPNHWKAYYNLGLLYYRWNRLEESLASFKAANRISRGRIRRVTDLMHVAERFLKLPPWQRGLHYGVDLMRQGAYQEALAAFERSIAEAGREGSLQDPKHRGILVGPYYYMACIYAQAAAGRKGSFAEVVPPPPDKRTASLEKAIAALQKSVDMGFNQADVLDKDRQLSPLRKLPAFQALVKKVKGR